MDPIAEDLHLRAEISRLASVNMTRGRELTELQTELDAARAEIARLRGSLRRTHDEIAPMETELDAARARLAALGDTIDDAHGIICNAHQKRVDDVTTDDGASPGWAEAARRWIDAYPPAALDAVSAAGSASLGELERQIKALVDQYNARHRGETGCTCRTILAGMTAHGCPRHDRHDEDE